MRAASPIGLGFVLLVAGACKSFTDGTSSEETPSPIEAGAPESGVETDATVPPTTSVLDASADASDLPVDAFGAIAITDYTLFDDFERDNPIQGGVFGWNKKGVIANTTCPSVMDCSPDRAISMWVHAGDPPVMTTDLDADSTTLRFDFAMRTDAHGQTISHAQLASIQINDSRNIYVEVRNGILRIGDQKKVPNAGKDDYDNQEIDLAPHINDKWVRYRIYADFTKNFAGVWRDGTVLGVKQLRPFITAKPCEPEKMRLGTAHWDGKTELDIYVDDVGKVDASNE